MSFEKDESFASEVGDFYGKYLTTFRSEHDQVRADLFQESGFLVAYVSFAKGVTPSNTKDAYVTVLSQFASENQFKGKLRLVMSEST